MRQFPAILSLALLGAAPTAAAEVIDAAPGGFSLAHEVIIDAPRAEVWAAAVGNVGSWWSSDHTISGDAANMSIDPVPQGCFCEAIGDHAGVVHLTVTFVNPGVLLRLTGGLGPLGLMGVDGNMTWECGRQDPGEVRLRSRGLSARRSRHRCRARRFRHRRGAGPPQGLGRDGRCRLTWSGSRRACNE